MQSKTYAYTGLAAHSPVEPDLSQLEQTEDLSETINKKICFIFAHEQAHQIPHCAPILNEVCEMDNGIEVNALVLGQANTDILKGLMSAKARQRTVLTRLKAPIWWSLLEKIIGGAGPLERIFAMRAHAKQLMDMSVIVAPNITALMLKTKFGVAAKMVYTQHGAGDRAIGFHSSIRQFDHVLIPGQKILNRMQAEGLVTEGQYSVIGYPKFDNLPHVTDQKVLFADSDKPTVLYCPHFDPSLSSWYKAGEAVLDYFAQQDRYNLIFAPHVMLFTRKLHVTSDLKMFQWRKNISAAYSSRPNIFVDKGSIASIDMTYTKQADIYLGDASSQVYEFLVSPRPCLFLDVHNTQWLDNPNYAHWQLGDVINSVDDLDEALGKAMDMPERYSQLQAAAFLRTFGPNLAGGSRRAAEMLVKLANEN